GGGAPHPRGRAGPRIVAAGRAQVRRAAVLPVPPRRAARVDAVALAAPRPGHLALAPAWLVGRRHGGGRVPPGNRPRAVAHVSSRTSPRRPSRHDADGKGAGGGRPRPPLPTGPARRG